MKFKSREWNRRLLLLKQICPESMRWLRRTRVWLCLIGALVWTFFFQASRARGDRSETCDLLLVTLWIYLNHPLFLLWNILWLPMCTDKFQFFVCLETICLGCLVANFIDHTRMPSHTHTPLSLSLVICIYICTCMDMHPFVYIVFWGFPWCMWANLYGMN